MVFIDSESCCVTRLKERLITFAIRFSRLPKRSFVDWKSVLQCDKDSFVACVWFWFVVGDGDWDWEGGLVEDET